MSRKKIDATYVKDYFKREGTISNWWEPEGPQKGLKEVVRPLYVQQRLDVVSLCDPKGKHFLDTGTGKGRFAISFAEHGAKRVTAIDISREMLDIARSRSKEAKVADKIDFTLGDVESLGYADDTFDITCCMETFDHLPDPQKAVGELGRVTKPGGLIVANATTDIYVRWKRKQQVYTDRRLFLRYIYFSRPASPLRCLACWLFGYPYVERHVGAAYKKQEFLTLFTEKSISIAKLQGYGDPPFFYLLVAQKQA